MNDDPQMSWAEGELYELLCLMVIGACIWLAGTELGLFDAILAFIVGNNLLDVVLLSFCMNLGIFVAAMRKSLLLRNAMMARIEAERRAEAIARHDALTGVANRRYFMEAFDHVIATRRDDEHHAVFMIDLDRFKPVNDAHGHAAGNVVLCAVADRLKVVLPAQSVVARLGGDEFVVLTPFDGTQLELTRIAQRVIDKIREPVMWNHSQIDVDATVGIAVLSQGLVDAEAALHEADLAMYEGKREGRGRFRLFQIELDTNLRLRAQLQFDLRVGIERGELTPFFQPIVKLPSQDLVGFEVLSRWHHPTKGLIMPDVFIPLAEETGMITDLFYSILKQSCDIARAWPLHLHLSVNLAPQQLLDMRLPEKVLSVLTETGFAPARLEIEITESALINDLEAARTVLTSLQNLGVKIALDDFGTGYSSLYHLKELKFDKLKIDKSYVNSLLQDTERAKLVDAIISLGESLSMQTTAEGVENASDLNWLSSQGCTYGQGFLFGRPMPKDCVEAYLLNGAIENPDEDDMRASA